MGRLARRRAGRVLPGLVLWGLGFAMPGLAAAQATTATTTATTAAPAAAGTISVHVDATDLDHRILAVRQSMPVQPGPLKLWLARWIPGDHGPTGAVQRLAGLQLSTGDGGRRLPWRRDPLDTHAFLLDVPAGTTRLDIAFQHLSPATADSGRRVMTPQLVNLQWNDLLLYPAGPTMRDIAVQASITLPAGWEQGSALPVEQKRGAQVRFAPVSLEMLIDSPVFAGRHLRRIDLDPAGQARPATLVLLGDSPAQLKADDDKIAAHRRLVQQADALFGSRPFARYEMLFALSDELGEIGLEHHQSSENVVKPGYFDDWDKTAGDREQLPHEYVHAWNGKYRRPADQLTPNFNVPLQNSLLWLYEGQTEFWSKVLAARAGLVNMELARDELAQLAARQQRRTGRAWRNLQDTTHDAVLRPNDEPLDWPDWQRVGADYYLEGVLLWLDADSLIREKSEGRRSLDDFARRFFGGADGDLGPRPYTFDDVVAALDAVQPHDWARFLRERLDAHDAAPLDGLARAGWRLEFGDMPSSNFSAHESHRSPGLDLADGLGMALGAEGRLRTVAWNGPAFKAGLAPGLQLVAVNMKAYKPEVLREAVAANRDGKAPIELLVRAGEDFRLARIDYRGGLRYPKLVRIDATPDRLTPLLTPLPTPR